MYITSKERRFVWGHGFLPRGLLGPLPWFCGFKVRYGEIRDREGLFACLVADGNQEEGGEGVPMTP